MISDTKRIAYSLFGQTVLLLILYAAAALLSAVKFMAQDPLALSLPYHHVNALANVLLHLAVLSGLLGSGVYIASGETPSGLLWNERWLTRAFWLWTLLLILAFFAGVLGILAGRSLLELPPVLALLKLAALALFLYTIARSIPKWTAVPTVWMSGLVLSAVCTALGLLPTSDYLLDRALRVLAASVNLHVAWTLAALALGFWLILRFSSAPQQWAELGVYSVGGLLALAGFMLSLPALYPLGAAAWLGGIAVFFVPVAYLIFAAHSYRGFADRNGTNTLAAHWYALAVLLFLGAAGFLGALQSAPGISQWTLGTRLTDLQTTLTSFAVVAVLLGMINQACAEIRGKNERITGLVPFWLVTFGLGGGGIALLLAGVLQVFLERVLTVGYLETQVYMIPLYVLWIIGTLLLALGLLAYALGFWARRPQVSA